MRRVALALLFLLSRLSFGACEVEVEGRVVALYRGGAGCGSGAEGYVIEVPAAMRAEAAAASAPEPAPMPVPEPVPEVVAKEPPPESEGGWLLQLAVYADPANVRRMKGLLEGEGRHVQLATLSRGGRELTAVRVGPFADPAAAAAAKRELDGRYGVKSVVQRAP